MRESTFKYYITFEGSYKLIGLREENSMRMRKTNMSEFVLEVKIHKDVEDVLLSLGKHFFAHF